VLPSLVKSNPALPPPTFIKAPATALASRPYEQSCADISTPVQVALLTAIDRDRANRVGTYNDDWTGLVDGTNAEKFCGSDNWRMPTIEELYSIADLSIAKPVIDGDYFPNTVTSSFWSSSPYSENDTNAWIVDFYLGYVYHYRRSDKYYQVRLVHSKQ
jgi:hypothetical protein